MDNPEYLTTLDTYIEENQNQNKTPYALGTIIHKETQIT
jgi:DNA-binding PucR family transcriptional regulator